MRILIIPHSYRPNITPRAFRWSAIAQEWAANGHEVDVIAAAGCCAPAEEVLSGVHVYRPGSSQLDRLRTSLLRARCDSSSKRGPPTEAVPRSSSRKSLLKRLYDSTWKQVWWPDRACLWYFSARRLAARLARQRGYDVVLTSSHPFTCHLVGKTLKKRWTHTRWIVDIGDPFCFAREMPLNNFLIYRPLNWVAERSVFGSADCVVVTNSRTRDRYEEAFGDHAHGKIRVIGPAIPESVLSEEGEREPFGLSSDRINIVFAGNLLNPVRRPLLFMQWISRVAQQWNRNELCPLAFHLIGDNAEELRPIAAAQGIQAVVECHGRTERARALVALGEAQVLLNCGNVTDYQLPSKVYEYMATGKPIINVVFNPLDPSVTALQGYSPVLHATAESVETDDVVKFISGCARDGFKGETGLRVPSIVREHLVPQIARKYEALLYDQDATFDRHSHP